MPRRNSSSQISTSLESVEDPSQLANKSRSPPCMIYNLKNTYGNNSETVLYILGSSSTPRRKYHVNYSKKNWGTPETAYYREQKQLRYGRVSKSTAIKKDVIKIIQSELIKMSSPCKITPVKTAPINEIAKIKTIVSVKGLINKFESIGQPACTYVPKRGINGNVMKFKKENDIQDIEKCNGNIKKNTTDKLNCEDEKQNENYDLVDDVLLPIDTSTIPINCDPIFSTPLPKAKTNKPINKYFITTHERDFYEEPPLFNSRYFDCQESSTMDSAFYECTNITSEIDHEIKKSLEEVKAFVFRDEDFPPLPTPEKIVIKNFILRDKEFPPLPSPGNNIYFMD